LVEFDGSTVVVTGGAIGLGKTFCQRFAREGAQVAVLDIDLDGATRLANEINESGSKALAVTCDVADESGVGRAIDAVVTGLGAIDVLVNNAGRHLKKYGQPFSALTSQDMKELFDVNLFGTVYCSLAVRESMRSRGGGSIINIASQAAHDVRNAYGVSKLAVRGASAAFARDYASDGIRVNAVSPGLVATDSMLEDFGEQFFSNVVKEQMVARPASTDDIADVVLFLASSRSAFITGQTLLANGGRSTFI
jgi:NAD(P)-dependent dehydrogenase (short-subunit alcohol dehydrogenase family)